MQCFYLRFPSPFAHVYMFCQCASPRKHRVCVALPFCTRLFVSVCFASQTPGLCCAVSSLPYKFVRLYALFVLYNRFCVVHFLISPCKLRVCLGQSPSFYLALLFSEVFCYANFVSQISLLSSAIPSTPILNFIAYVFQCILCACIVSRT